MRRELPVRLFDTKLVRVNTQMFLNTALRGVDRSPEIDEAVQRVIADTTMLSGGSMQFGELVDKLRTVLSGAVAPEISALDPVALAEMTSGPA